MLELRNISKTVGKKKILDNVSCQVEAGSIAIFLGPSGVGKSTLLRVLNNLETIDSGTVLLNNKILDLQTVNKTHTIGMVFQNFALFEHVSVIENITIPLIVVQKKSKPDAEIIAKKLLDDYQLTEYKDSPISRLSGGQKQRLSIARTLALSPKVICLDEPTSALDPLLTNYIAQIIMDLKHRGYIVLIATHDTTLVKKLSAMLYLVHKGTLVEKAKSETFFHAPEQYPALRSFMWGQ